MRVAIIPARGGSVRIPKKNIRPFHGKPILAYSIQVAKKSALFDIVAVSTENSEIGSVALEHGAFVLWRPAPLDQDYVGTQEVMREAVGHFPLADQVCCIYATAPMLTIEDLRYGLQMLMQCATPFYFYVPGIFYWGRRHSFRNGVRLEGNGLKIGIDPTERYIDINTEADWVRAEEMYAMLHPREEPA